MTIVKLFMYLNILKNVILKISLKMYFNYIQKNPTKLQHLI